MRLQHRRRLNTLSAWAAWFRKRLPFNQPKRGHYTLFTIHWEFVILCLVSMTSNKSSLVLIFIRRSTLVATKDSPDHQRLRHVPSATRKQSWISLPRALIHLIFFCTVLEATSAISLKVQEPCEKLASGSQSQPHTTRYNALLVAKVF